MSATLAAPARSRPRVAVPPAAGLLLLTALSWIVYARLGEGFLSSFNLFTLSQLLAETAVIGAAQLVVVAIGHLNLAVGAVGVVVAMSTGWMLGVAGLPTALAIPLGLAEGAILGALMGVLERITGLGSFIVTLAMASILSGAVLIASGGGAISTLPEAVTAFGADPMLLPSLSWLLLPAVLVFAFLWLLYRRSVAGWQMLSVGANERAAALSGVPTFRIVVSSFALSGLFSAVAAMLELSRVASALPSLGTDWLLLAFIVPILGGSPLRGGAVALGGALLAALFIVSINSGLVSLGVSAYWQEFAQGVVLLLAVFADRLFRRDAGRSHA
ncbi:MAG: ABC transporter permease [Gluconacetobacter diazotrophicus]|nr:ABC transporter permease [Gluconacetobacter diazotrophicus]